MAASSTAQQKPSQAAFLHRCVSLNDRHATQVLTFILPPHLVKGYLSECSSKDFTYGYQKWRVAFTRDEKHLGCYLALRSPADCTEVTLDFSFTILNRSHFTGNETYQERGIVFDHARQRFGRSNFLCVTDLERRGFLFPDQKALVEIELRSACTEFREELQLPRELRELQTLERIDTSYFAFAGCDWNLAVHLREPDEYGNLRQCVQPSIQMYRHSSFDHWCRVRYRVTFQLGDVVYQSDVIDQMLDAKGYGDSYAVVQTSLFAHLTPRFPLKV